MGITVVPNPIAVALAGQVLFKDQWCDAPVAEINLTAVATDRQFSPVVFPAGFLPAGCVIHSVYLTVAWRSQLDTSAGANAVGVGGSISVMPTGGVVLTDSIDAINTIAGYLLTPTSTLESGHKIVSPIDISAVVNDVENVSYDVFTDDTDLGSSLICTAASLQLRDVYTMLRVYYIR